MASLKEHAEPSSSTQDYLCFNYNLEPESHASSDSFLQKQLIEESEEVLEDLQEILNSYPKKSKHKKTKIEMNVELNADYTSLKCATMNEVNLDLGEANCKPESRRDNLDPENLLNETVEDTSLQLYGDVLEDAGTVTTNMVDSCGSAQVTELVPENCESEPETSRSSSPECQNIITLARQMKPCYIPVDQNEVTEYMTQHQQTSYTSEQPTILEALLQSQLEEQPVKAVKTTKSRSLTCTICKSTFKYAITLRRHNAFYHNTEPVCKYCRGFFIHLEAHMNICKLRPQVAKMQSNPIPTTPISCPISINSAHEELPHSSTIQVNAEDLGSETLFNRSTPQENKIKTSLKEVNIDKTSKNATYYYCGICKKIFASNEALQNHKNLLHNMDTKCVKCNNVFPSSLDRDMHMQSCKQDPILTIPNEEDKNLRKRKCTESFSCIIPECKKSFPFMFGLRRHCDSAHSRDQLPSCRECKKIFYSQEEKLEHSCIAIDDKMSKKRPCAYCHKSYTNVAKHQTYMHGSRPFCPACECMFGSLEDLEIHLRKCRKMKNKRPTLQCSSCTSLFLTKFQRRIHEAFDHCSEPICMICNVFFETYDILKTHTMQIHGNASEQVSMAYIDSESVMINIEQSNDPVISETDSNSQFPLLATSIDSQYSQNGKSNFICLVCNASFEHRSSCIKHIQSHKKIKNNTSNITMNESMPSDLTLYCHTCNKSWPNIFLFEEHKTKCKNETKTTTCTTHKSSNTSLIGNKLAPSVDSNINNVSKKSKDVTYNHYQCPLCVAIMRTQNMLDMHMKYFHNIHNEKLPSNICTVCGCRCTSVSALQQHMTKTHGVDVSDTRNKAIRSRSKTATKLASPKSKTNVKSHPKIASVVTNPDELSVQTSSSKRVQLCNICNKHFGHLRRHQAVAHNTEPICRRCHKYLPSFEAVEKHVPICYSQRGLKRRNTTLLRKKIAVGLNNTSPTKGQISYNKKSVPLVCEYCSITYSKGDSLRKHINLTHKNVLRLRVCCFCKSYFKYDYQLQQHLLTCVENPEHINDISPQTNASVISPQTNASVISPQTTNASDISVACEPMFEHINLALVKTEMESDDASSITSAKNFEVTDTNYEGEITNHKSSNYHNTTFPMNVCDMCNASFPNVIDLKLHMNLKHDGTFLLCDPCKLEFKNVPDFVGHIHSCQKSKEYQSNEKNNDSHGLIVHDVKHIKEENFNMI